MRCGICFYLYNLKYKKNTHGGVLLLVDWRKVFTLVSNRVYCQRSSPSWISDKLRAVLKPAQNLNSGFVEWSCAVVITTTTRHHRILLESKLLIKVQISLIIILDLLFISFFLMFLDDFFFYFRVFLVYFRTWWLSSLLLQCTIFIWFICQPMIHVAQYGSIWQHMVHDKQYCFICQPTNLHCTVWFHLFYFSLSWRKQL